MSQGRNNNQPFNLWTNPTEFDPQFLFSSNQNLLQMFAPEIQQYLLKQLLNSNLIQCINQNSLFKDCFQAPNLLSKDNYICHTYNISYIQYFSTLMNGMLSYLPNPVQSQPQLNQLKNQKQENQNRKMKHNESNVIIVDNDEPIKTNKKCQNVQCKNVGDKKVKSKRNDFLFFCEKCSKLYNKGNYCDFCEQVYSSYDDEAGWVQCDQCQKWNHITCEQKYRNQNIENESEITPYHCLDCFKNIKKTKQFKKQEEISVQKQDFQSVQEDCKNKEKNITFVATKDNKIQYTYRLNLLDDEIKLDLDLLRNSIKKNKKISLTSPSNVLHQNQSQKQQETQDECQLSSRSLRRRINQRLNYRDLVGEH